MDRKAFRVSSEACALVKDRVKKTKTATQRTLLIPEAMLRKRKFAQQFLDRLKPKHFRLQKGTALITTDDDSLAHLSLIGWEHIDLTGDYI